MAQEIITLENLAAEIAKLRGELATWKALAIKQDRLNTAQMLAVNSGATAGKIAQIVTNTSDIAALQQIASSAFRVVKVAQLPATGESYIMYLVPQTDGEVLNYCNEYLWIDNAWELVGATGAMANNGELQIIVNGVTVGTFTANQATNSTASITVPTDTSQLTNGAGYVDATALATALASKQDSLSLTQLAAVNSGITSADVAQIGTNTTAIAGKQDALTSSQLSAVNSGITSADVAQIGTNTGNIATNSAAIVSLQGSKQNTLSSAQLLAVNSGITSSLVTQIGTNQSDITTLNTALGQSLTPSADNTYSLGGASFRYANVYAVTFTGDLTGTASKAISDEDGTSIKTGYVNVAGIQEVTGDKSFTGSNTFNSILPNATNTYSLGSSSYQWSAVYAQSYYYNGTAWGLDKANVWTGNNDFRTLRLYGVAANELVAYPPSGEKGDSSTFGFNLRCLDKNLGNYNNSGVAYVGLGQSGGTSYVALNASTIGSTDHNVHSIQIGLAIAASDNANVGSLYPNQNGGINLGTSTNKWKTLNGINPGALSLPTTATTDASGDIVPPSGESSINLSGGANTYTPSNNGWLTLAINCASGNCIIVRQNTSNRDTLNYMQGYVPGQANIYLTLPVLAGVTYYIFLYATSFIMARFALCQGNV